MGEETRAGPAWPTLVLVTVTAIASAGVASAVWTTPGDSGPPAVVDPAVQLATVAAACETWTGETERTTLGDGEDEWCAALTNWLSDALTRTARSPWLLWGRPETLHATCLTWLTERPPDLAHRDGLAWCDDLVSWMAGHVGDWSDDDGWAGWRPSVGSGA